MILFVKAFQMCVNRRVSTVDITKKLFVNFEKISLSYPQMRSSIENFNFVAVSFKQFYDDRR